MTHVVAEPCFDCEAYVAECPVEAIFHEDNIPERWKDDTALNAEMAKRSPNIVEKQDPLKGEVCAGKKK